MIGDINTFKMTIHNLLDYDVTTNSPFQDYSHQDDQTTHMTETPWFKLFPTESVFFLSFLLLLGELVSFGVYCMFTCIAVIVAILCFAYSYKYQGAVSS